MWYTSLEGWCIVATTVRPAAARSLRMLQTVYAVKVSRPDVGSSRKMMDGAVDLAFLKRSRIVRSASPRYGESTSAPLSE